MDYANTNSRRHPHETVRGWLYLRAVAHAHAYVIGGGAFWTFLPLFYGVYALFVYAQLVEPSGYLSWLFPALYALYASAALALVVYLIVRFGKKDELYAEAKSMTESGAGRESIRYISMARRWGFLWFPLSCVFALYRRCRDGDFNWARGWGD